MGYQREVECEMRKIVVVAFMSLDGIVQSPGRHDEDTEGGFELGGWTQPFGNKQVGENALHQATRATALLLGRKTYDIFGPYWPTIGDASPISKNFNRIPKYVASRTLKSVDWNNASLIEGDLAEEVAKIKEQEGGEIMIYGSTEICHELAKHDLIDEYNLMIYPVLLGTGKRLFADGATPGKLKLADSTTTNTGVIINTYTRDGKLNLATPKPQLRFTE